MNPFHADSSDQGRARDVAPTLLMVAALAAATIYLAQVIVRVALERAQFAAVICCDDPAGGGFGMALLASPRPGISERVQP